MKKEILEKIASFGKKRVRRRQLYKLMEYKHIGYEDFKAVLTELEHSGEVVRLKGRRFALPDAEGLFTGVFTLSRNGGGHVRSSNGDTFYVRPRDTYGAVSGDRVRAKKSRSSRPGFSPTAKITAIEERSAEPVIGVFHMTGPTAFVIPRDKGYPFNLLVNGDVNGDVSDGDLVVVRLENPLPGHSMPSCTVVEVLGDPDSPGVDVLAIIRRHSLPLDFPGDVERAVEEIPADLTEEIITKRRDIRSMVIFTIDPDDAKDFDDAVSIEKTDDGSFLLGVHIADVAHYVPDGSIIDREAEERGMSCYLVDRVIPMLPERLSNDLCSLRPREDRLTKSVFAEIDRQGTIRHYEIDNTVIHSNMRLTYGQVQAYLDNGAIGEASDITEEVGEKIRSLSDLTDILIDRRSDRGALDFENPEAKVVLDESGRAVDVVKRTQLKAHRMIEEAMITANVVTAKALAGVDAPLLYRVHEEPDDKKLAAFAETADALGFRFKASLAGERGYIQAFLQSIKGADSERTINMLLLRSMKRACYSPANRGHYGLSLPVYGHFTSPIRRYPDLVTHRQLDRRILGCDDGVSHDDVYFTALGDAVTERELVTDEAERESIKMKIAELMSHHIGEEFNGVVSGVVSVGFFVEIGRYFAEGLVHVSSLLDDYYTIDRSGVSLVGRSTGRRYMIGDEVRIVVTKADKDSGEIDFMIVETARPKRKKNKRKRRK